MVFRAILQSWLQNAARQKVRETVMQAAREQLQAAGEKAQQGPPGDDEVPPCHVGVVFALGIEAGGLDDLLEGAVTIKGREFAVREGGLAGRRVALAISGAGGKNAAKAAEMLMAGHQPAWVISAGFAGGLCAGFRRGEILVADRLLDGHGNQVTLDPKKVPGTLSAQGENCHQETVPGTFSAPGVRVGGLLSWDRPVRLPQDKKTLGRRYGALAVDMETFAVAAACRSRGVRFLAARVISDELNDELPREVGNLLNQKTGAARLGAAAGALFNRPSSFKDLWKLKENALVASDRLAKFLAATIPHLPLQ